MNLSYLRYFVQLAQTRHYTKTAQQLCITQPSLSHAIAQLEEELGVPLFEKNGRNTTLTRFGEEFLACARHTLATLDGGIASLQRSARGEGLIRLGFLRPVGIDYIPTLASDFIKENTGKDIQFTFHTGSTGQLLDGLMAGKFDLVFCSQPQEDLHLPAVPVISQQLVIITPKDHPLAVKISASPKDLLTWPMIYFSQGAGLRQVVEHLFSKTGSLPPTAYETEEDQVIAGLVARGFGISIVPYMELLEKLDLKILTLDSPASTRQIYMVYNDKVFMPPVVRGFFEYARQTFHGLGEDSYSPWKE